LLASLVRKFGLKVRLTGQLKEFQWNMLDWRGNLCAYVTCTERSKRQTGKTVKKCTTMYPRKCDVGLCIGQCFEIYNSKLNYWE
jgi:hypothetical protein